MEPKKEQCATRAPSKSDGERATTGTKREERQGRGMVRASSRAEIGADHVPVLRLVPLRLLPVRHVHPQSSRARLARTRASHLSCKMRYALFNSTRARLWLIRRSQAAGFYARGHNTGGSGRYTRL